MNTNKCSILNCLGLAAVDVEFLTSVYVNLDDFSINLVNVDLNCPLESVICHLTECYLKPRQEELRRQTGHWRQGLITSQCCVVC